MLVGSPDLRHRPRVNLQLAAQVVTGPRVRDGASPRVNAVAPSFIWYWIWYWHRVLAGRPNRRTGTQAGFNQRVSVERVGTVTAIASTYLHLMLNTFIMGQVLAVEGGVIFDK
jgi:hypothetical protein